MAVLKSNIALDMYYCIIIISYNPLIFSLNILCDKSFVNDLTIIKLLPTTVYHMMK